MANPYLSCQKSYFFIGKTTENQQRSCSATLRTFLSAHPVRLTESSTPVVTLCVTPQDDALFGVWSIANVLFCGTSRAPSPTEIGANIVLSVNLILWSSWGGGTQELAGANETRSEQTIFTFIYYFLKFFEVSERENRRFLPLSVAKQFLIKKVLTENLSQIYLPPRKL